VVSEKRIASIFTFKKQTEQEAGMMQAASEVAL
jgi:hypothetical protein